MTVLPNILITLPTRGAPGSGLWGDTEDANLALIDAHDHSTGKGVRVKTAGIDLNADLPFSSLYAPTQLHRLQFSEIAAGGLTGSNNKSLFVSDGTSGLTIHELYWRNNTGTHVKLTSGNALNVAAFVGGIGGDYTSVSAALNYDDAGQRYTFKQGGGTTWARLASSDLRLFEHGSTDSVYVGQAAPAALAVSYTMTWPTALPSVSTPVTISNTGVFTFGASFPRTFYPSFVFGAVVAAAANPVGGLRPVCWQFTGAGTVFFSIPCSAGETITGFSYEAYGDGAADVTAGTVTYSASMGTAGANLATWTDTNRAAAWGAVNVGTFTSQLIATGGVLTVSLLVNAANYYIGAFIATFTR